MTIVTNTTDRKALAKAIADELGTTARFLGPPTFGYQVGSYTVDREGKINGEDFEALRDFLQRNGYAAEEPVSQEHDNEPGEEAPADSGAREPVTSMNISIPAFDVTLTQLKNLVFMLYSRQDLINRMTQSDCLNIPEILVQRLADVELESPEAFTNLLDDCKAMVGLTGFDYRDGRISMAFPYDETEPTRWTAYAHLLGHIFDAAIKAARVFPGRVQADAQNEKYLAHTWLQRLGYSGADSKAERKILLGHLAGYCAFANSSKMQAYKEKYTAIRRERRTAEQGAAAPDVTTGEGDGNE